MYYRADVPPGSSIQSSNDNAGKDNALALDAFHFE